MAETRSKTYIYLIGEPEPQFSGRVLPTSLEVLRIYFFHHKKNSQTLKDAIKTVVQQLCEIWAKARIPTAEHRSIVRKTEALLERYRNISKNKSHGGPAQHVKEEDFLNSVNCLFEIAHYDALKLIKIEEDQIFLADQHSERKYAIGGVDRILAKKEESKESRMQKEVQCGIKEEERKRKSKECLEIEKELLSSSDSSSKADNAISSNEDYIVASEQKCSIYKICIFQGNENKLSLDITNPGYIP